MIITLVTLCSLSSSALWIYIVACTCEESTMWSYSCNWVFAEGSQHLFQSCQVILPYISGHTAPAFSCSLSSDTECIQHELLSFSFPPRECLPGSTDQRREMSKRLTVSRNVIVFKLDLNKSIKGLFFFRLDKQLDILHQDNSGNIFILFTNLYILAG